VPNWCENNLRIYADKETKQKILSECVSKDEYGHDRLDFENLIPIGDITDWYNRRIEKWGTKWNSCDCCISEADNDLPLVIDMMTALSPPVPVIQAITQRYHCDTRLEYYEYGMAFRGIAEAIWVDGEVVECDDCRNMTDDDYRKLGLLDEVE
jgi:hypothetical protein